MIRKLEKLGWFLGLLMAFSACGSEEEPEAPVTLTVSPHQIEAPTGEFSIAVEASVPFQCTVDVAWLKIQSTTATAVVLAAEPNTDYAVREGHVTVTAGEKQEVVTVTQPKGVPVLTAEVCHYEATAAGKEITVELQCNLDFQVEISEDFVTQTTSRSPSLTTRTFLVAENTSAKPRGALIRFTNTESGLCQRIYVHQEGVTPAVTPYEYVDLGLPSGTLWAKVNVGATSAYEAGDFLAWGETAPQEDLQYTAEKYKFSDDLGSDSLKWKYYVVLKEAPAPDYGFEKAWGEDQLYVEDDAAAVNWDNHWRMPTQQQVEELLRYCRDVPHYASMEDYPELSEHDFCFVELTGPNGNSILIRQEGFRYKGIPDDMGPDACCYLWSRTLSNDPNATKPSASALVYGWGNGWVEALERNRGANVRPVYVK